MTCQFVFQHSETHEVGFLWPFFFLPRYSRASRRMGIAFSLHFPLVVSAKGGVFAHKVPTSSYWRWHVPSSASKRYHIDKHSGHMDTGVSQGKSQWRSCVTGLYQASLQHYPRGGSHICTTSSQKLILKTPDSLHGVPKKLNKWRDSSLHMYPLEQP